MVDRSSNNTLNSRAMPQNTRLTIGLLDHGIPSEFDSSENFRAGVAEVTRERDVNLIYFEGGMLQDPLGFESQANILYDLVSPESVDGLIVSGIVAHHVGPAAMKQFCGRYAPLPIVTLEVPVPGSSCVLSDFYQGMSAAVVHLIEVHDYRRIAFIRGAAESLTAEARYRAYTDALSRYGIPFDENLVTAGTFFASSGSAAVQVLFDERKLRPQQDIQVIVAANDYMALDALQALQARGINVPGEVALVGFDDIERCCSVTPALTSVQMLSYEAGRRLAELLLARLDGRDVPEQVILPAELVVRESCGCLDPIMLRTQAEALTSTSESCEVSLTARRREILSAMTLALGRPVAGLSPNWAEQLLDALLGEVMSVLSDTSADAHFLFTLDEMLRQSTISGADVSAWQKVVTALRHQVLPSLDSRDLTVALENVWQQAQMRIGRIAQRTHMHKAYQTRLQAQTLQRIEQRLITTFDVEGLMQILAEGCPQLRISSCYLALYEDPQPDSAPHTVPAWSRLILAYNEQGRIPLEPGGRRFPSRRLIPGQLSLKQRCHSIMIEALYFGEQQLGFVLFEVDARERLTCDVLRGRIGSALQGALLVRQVKAHAAELVKKQYVLDTFLETVPDCIYFKDREGRITQANKAHALQLKLRDPADEIGKTDFDFFSAEQAQVKYEQEQIILQTGQPLLNAEERIQWADGHVEWLLTTKMPLRDEHDEIIGTFGISRDITGLKQAEREILQYRDHLEDLVKDRTTELTQINTRLHQEIIERTRIERALRTSEQQCRILAENVIDGLVVVQDGQFVFSNKVFTDMTGYPPEHFIPADPVSLLHIPETQAEFPLLGHAGSEDRETQWQAELVTKNGRIIWTEIGQAAIAWNGQQALLLTIRDISERKLRERRLEEERSRLEEENLSLKSSIRERFRFGELVGKSLPMQRVYELIVSAAASDVNALVAGESGTGKELIARTLHQVSRRKAQPFVPVNCASIPETLFEREFFGHRKGSFTGADRDSPGLFDRAHRGLLFLDEVTELSPGMQAKLLRVLQDGEYTPLGANSPRQADVLIVAATNKAWAEEIAGGRLRKDFFYRIGVIEIDVPPLRERKEDLPLLIEHLLEQYRNKQAEALEHFPRALPADETMLPGELTQALYAYDWPGNVRELQNVLQRYLATRNLNAILQFLGLSVRSLDNSNAAANTTEHLSLSQAIQSLEKRMIANALAKTHYHIGNTAKELGMPRRTLQNKIKKYNFTLKSTVY